MGNVDGEIVPRPVPKLKWYRCRLGRGLSSKRVKKAETHIKITKGCVWGKGGEVGGCCRDIDGPGMAFRISRVATMACGVGYRVPDANDLRKGSYEPLGTISDASYGTEVEILTVSESVYATTQLLLPPPGSSPSTGPRSTSSTRASKGSPPKIIVKMESI